MAKGFDKVLEEFESKMNGIKESVMELTPGELDTAKWMSGVPRDYAKFLSFLWKDKYGQTTTREGAFRNWAYSMIENSEVEDKTEAMQDIIRIDGQFERVPVLIPISR